VVSARSHIISSPRPWWVPAGGSRHWPWSHRAIVTPGAPISARTSTNGSVGFLACSIAFAGGLASGQEKVVALVLGQAAVAEEGLQGPAQDGHRALRHGKSPVPTGTSLPATRARCRPRASRARQRSRAGAGSRLWSVGRDLRRRCPATSPRLDLRRRRGFPGDAGRSPSALAVASSVEEPAAPLSAADDEQHLRVAPAPSASRRQTRQGGHGHPGTGPWAVNGLRPRADARRPGCAHSGLDLPQHVRAGLLHTGSERASARVGDLLRFPCRRRTHGYAPQDGEVAGSGATR
jgi:hypothetical protein